MTLGRLALSSQWGVYANTDECFHDYSVQSACVSSKDIAKDISGKFTIGRKPLRKLSQFSHFWTQLAPCQTTFVLLQSEVRNSIDASIEIETDKKQRKGARKEQARVEAERRIQELSTEARDFVYADG